jgi:SAM-dependent methyltransferase
MSAFRTKASNLEDEFVQRVINKKGTFLDIGCGYGGPGNNTLVLEEEGWTGTLIDSNQPMMEHNATLRKCRLCVANLPNVNWFELLGIPQNQELTIDYISISSSDNILEIVRNFPWNKIWFRTLTLKHDEVNNGPAIKEETRRILAQNRYLMVAGDVCYDFCYKRFKSSGCYL